MLLEQDRLSRREFFSLFGRLGVAVSVGQLVGTYDVLLPNSWDEDSSVMLGNFFRVLPNHFYEKNDNGKLTVVLSDWFRSHAFDYLGLHQVDVDYRVFQPQLYGEMFSNR